MAASNRKRTGGTDPADKQGGRGAVKKANPSGKEPAKASTKKAPVKSAAKKSVKKDKKPNIFQRFVQYLRDVRVELKRVIWPTRREVLNSSLVVISALLFFGVLIYLVDTGIVPVLSAFSKLAG